MEMWIVIDNVRLIRRQVLITEASVKERWMWIRVRVDVACGQVDVDLGKARWIASYLALYLH